MSTQAPPRGRRLPPDERRAVIEDAAARLFGEGGYAATRLDDIAAAANVTKPMLYRHFESKKGLYLALLERHRSQLGQFVEAPEEGPLELRLPRILEGWFAYFEEQPHTWKMMFLDTTGDGEIRAVRRDVQDSARAVFAAFIEAEPAVGVPPQEVEPLAEVLRGGMAGLARWWLDHPDVPRSVLVDTMLRVVRGLALASRPSSGP
jgi:AcrR family transcriptional regulator